MLFPPLIEEPPHADLCGVLVIPCYNESRIEALPQFVNCEPPSGIIEVIVLINEGEDESLPISQVNQELHEHLSSATIMLPIWVRLYPLYISELPPKKAGVGLARKIAMDEAVRRFEALGRDGIIINLDADCTIQSNYFTAIEKHFAENPGSWSAAVHYEHDISNLATDTPIVLYELHLRYFVAVQRWAGLPFAYQTLGSCMVSRSRAYQKMGGMNKRQAGEDFYFLQKFIEIGRHTELFSTTVTPSARGSDRVPFGTGKAIGQILDGQVQKTTSWQVFLPVKKMLNSIDIYLDADAIVLLPEEPMRSFLLKNNWEQKRREILDNSASPQAKLNRFFHWFNSFRVMKYAHFAQEFIPDIPVHELSNSGFPGFPDALKGKSPKELLEYMRIHSVGENPGNRRP